MGYVGVLPCDTVLSRAIEGVSMESGVIYTFIQLCKEVGEYLWEYLEGVFDYLRGVGKMGTLLLGQGTLYEEE